MASADVLTLFRAFYGAEPDVIASAPGRANLIGEHVDYCGGSVLPLAIAARTAVAVRALPRGAASRAVSAHGTAGAAKFDPTATHPGGRWTDYLTGVAQQLAAHGVPLPRMEIAVASGLPVGAGLASSAALEVAAAAAFAAIAGADLAPLDIAIAANRAEREYVGVPCGIMDQFASALATDGHALHIDCRTQLTTQVPFADAVLLVDTGTQRALAHTEYRHRVTECDAALGALRRVDPTLIDLASASLALIDAAALPPTYDRRARHVVQEVARVRAAVWGLAIDGHMDGSLLYASHASLRDLYECSTPTLDWVVDWAARQPGISGARLTGAGWGGCAIVVGDADALDDAALRLATDFSNAYGRQPAWWVSRAESGVAVERVHVEHGH